MARRSKTGKHRAGRLRIVAGNWRSRLLDIADVPGLRPTSERIRETLFNWLTPHIHSANCLDLFAGTGALGLEALSRGAGRAVFVENDAVAAESLRRNVEQLQADNATVVQADAVQYLRRFSERPFDIVFLDPPYAADLLGESCRLIDELGVLADRGFVYLEQDRGRPLPPLPEGWNVLKDKTAGNVRYVLVRHEAHKEPRQ